MFKLFKADLTSFVVTVVTVYCFYAFEREEVSFRIAQSVVFFTQFLSFRNCYLFFIENLHADRRNYWP